VGFETVVAADGREGFVGCSGDGTLFEDSSRTLLRIFDVSGVTGVFAVAFVGAAAGFGGATFAGAGGGDATLGGTAGFVTGFGTGFSAIIGFGGAVVDAFTTFGAAFVDFARVVDFLVSGESTSTGSEMTFLGLPLFLATSEDMLDEELGVEELWLRVNSQKGNFEVVVG
jgi:hypothetical protein